MRGFRYGCIALLLGFWTDAPAYGQASRDALPEADTSLTEACLENVLIARADDVSMDPRDCIGVAASACTELPGGYSTAGMIGCTNQEQEFWDDRLNRTYGRLIGDLEGQQTRIERLRQMQRDWIAFRKSSCFWESSQFDGGSIEPVVFNGCFMQMTAERALWMERSRAAGQP